MQRQCVPPRNGGKPCEGTGLLTQKCNTEACASSEAEEVYTRTNALSIQTRQFSMRPSREERCIVKEGDLDLVRKDLKDFHVKPRLPSRVVLNNQTLNIFETTQPKDLLMAIQLPNVQVENSMETGCIDVIDKKSAEKWTLCSMAMLGTDHQENIERWKDQMIFFAEKCYKKLPTMAPAASPIVKLRAKQVDDAIAESTGSVGVVNVNMADMMGKAQVKI